MKRLLSRATLATAVLFTTGAAFAQRPGFDISGYWTDIRQQDAAYETAAGDLADYTGLPINEADRLYALAYNASRLTLRQHQCFGYVSPYVYVAPGNYRIFEERDPYTEKLIAIKLLRQAMVTGGRPIEPSGWTGARILPPTRSTLGWDFPPASTKATS